MGMRLRYEVAGLDPVEHHLIGMSARALEPEPVLLMIAEIFRSIEKERFDKEGPGWEPNAASTIAQKEGDKVGVDSEAMRDALTKEGAEGSLSEVIGNTLHFGVNLTSEEGFPYPVVFDKGRKDGTQPARPLFDIGAEHLKLFTKAVQAYLVGLDRAEGFNMGGDRISGSDVMPGLGSNIFAGF